MAATPEPSPTTLAAALACGHPGCPCASTARRGHGNTHCPAHDDQHPSLSVDGRRGTVLWYCLAGCSQQAVLEALRRRGLWPEPPRSPTRELAYEIRDPDGRLVALHIRHESPDGGKRFSWCLPDGTPHLGGRRVVDLPLYGSERARDWPATATVVLCEGEKATDALLQQGIAAVGTVTGAHTTPSDASLRPLLRFATVILWPDNDAPGEQHMQRIAQRLRALGHRAVRQVVWPDAPPGGDAADVADADLIQRLIADAVPWQDAPDAPPADGRAPGKPPSQASILVQLAHARFELARTENGVPIAVPRQGPPIALSLRGERKDPRSLRGALAAAYREVTGGRTATNTALSDAMQTLSGEALAAPQIAPALRVARWEDGIVLDLGRDDGQVVLIQPSRWTVGSTPPGVVWRRTPLTGTLPEPVPGGDLRGLRALLNLSDDSWDLFIGTLVASLVPDIPHCIEFFRGPPGAGKSTAARLRVQLVDPSPVPLRQPPASLDDWCVGANGSWVVFLDNVSAVSAPLADALCRAATGDGLVRRALYTDDEPAVISFRRVVGITSIDIAALPGDLADRLIFFELQRIPDEQRREEAAIWAAFRQHHAAWVGALCELLAQVLAVWPTVRPTRLPRMADYARVLAAVDAVAGTRALATYLAQQGMLAADVVEADAVAAAVEHFAHQHGTWSGTASELWAALTPERPPRGWPADAARLSHRLHLAAEPLRRVGVTVTFSTSRRRGRRITITTQQDLLGNSVSPASPPASPTRAAAGETGTVASSLSGASVPAQGVTVPAQGPQPRVHDALGDGGTLGDAKIPPLSCRSTAAPGPAADVAPVALVPATCAGCGTDARRMLLRLAADGGVLCGRCSARLGTLTAPAPQGGAALQLIVAREGQDAHGRRMLLVAAAPVRCPRCAADLLHAELAWVDEQTLCCGACDAVVAVLPPGDDLGAEAAPGPARG